MICVSMRAQITRRRWKWTKRRKKQRKNETRISEFTLLRRSCSFSWYCYCCWALVLKVVLLLFSYWSTISWHSWAALTISGGSKVCNELWRGHFLFYLIWISKHEMSIRRCRVPFVSFSSFSGINKGFTQTEGIYWNSMHEIWLYQIYMTHLATNTKYCHQFYYLLRSGSYLFLFRDLFAFYIKWISSSY